MFNVHQLKIKKRKPQKIDIFILFTQFNISNNLTCVRARYNRGPRFALFPRKDSGFYLLDISLHTLPIPSALFMIANVAIWTVFNRENTMPCLTHDASSTTLFTYFRITGADRKLRLAVSSLLQFSRRLSQAPSWWIVVMNIEPLNDYKMADLWRFRSFTCNCVFWHQGASLR